MRRISQVGAVGVALVLAMMISVAIASKSDDEPPKDSATTEVRPDGVEITTFRDASGRQRRMVKLPTVNADRPYFEATVGVGEEAVTLFAQFTDPSAPPKVASILPTGAVAASDASSMIYRNCKTGWQRSFGAQWVNMTTYFNYDYSTVWGLSNAKQSFASPGFNWQGFGLWTSGGPQYAYSDIVAELWSGYFPLEFQISSDHMWHQVDAWGNCTPFYSLWP